MNKNPLWVDAENGCIINLLEPRLPRIQRTNVAVPVAFNRALRHNDNVHRAARLENREEQGPSNQRDADVFHDSGALQSESTIASSMAVANSSSFWFVSGDVLR